MTERPESGLWTGARIGVFGRTFDPPHVGHLQMARAARETLGLDRVVFSVAPRPPHKPGQQTTDLNHRLEMVRIAIADEDGAGLTRLEDEHEVSFTVDLLRACRARSAADLYFIVGADSLVELPTWREPGEIMRLATLVVFPRARVPVHLDVPGDASVVVFESPLVDVSSTDVRRRVVAGESPRELIAAGVAAYIERHALYGPG
jgi:nicotinate-nucleotide adenylyltransferase